MITHHGIKKKVIQYIQQISEEFEHPISAVEDHQGLVEDLGFTSLQIATLISFLGTEFGVDPFGSNTVSITDIRTIEDLCAAYEKTIAEK